MTIRAELDQLDKTIDDAVDRVIPVARVIAVAFVAEAVLLLVLVILAAVIAARLKR